MKRGFHILKRCLLTVLFFALVGIGVVLTVWQYPAVVVNTPNMLRLSAYLKKNGLSLEWRELQVSARSLSFLTKELSLSAGKTCFNESTLAGCFDSVAFTVDVRVKGTSLRIKIRQLELREGSLNYATLPSAKDEDRTGSSAIPAWPKLPSFLSSLSLENARMDLKKIRVKIGDERISGAASLKIDSQVSVEQGKKEGWDPLNVKADIELRNKKRFLAARIDGTAEANGINTTVTASANNLLENISSIKLKNCRLALKNSETEAIQNITTSCPIELRDYFPGIKADQIKVLVNGDLKIKSSAIPTSIEGRLDLAIGPFFEALRDGRGTVAVDISGSLAEFPNNVVIHSNASLFVDKFQNLVKLLRHYPWAIPSPFNTLDGNMSVTLEGRGSFLRDGGTFPVTFKTRLASENQKLDLDGKGDFKLQRSGTTTSGHLALNMVLNDVELVLPNFSPKAIPQFFPDGRIKGTPTRSTSASSSFTFSHDIEIVTPKGHPLRLSSNVVKDKVPLGLQVHLSDTEGTTGTVYILPFAANLFRRNATVRHFELRLKEDPDKTEVDGEVQVVYTDYTIRILVLGLLKEPQIKFISDPPLSEDKVIAVLLFGKTLDDLDEGQAASVGGTQAAVANGAISLASMYLLASTPIESVGYDPVTRVFRAKVRLADGTSLNVGSDMKALSEIGIRKRLGSHWAIVSYLENPLDPVQRTLTAFLEWSKGY